MNKNLEIELTDEEIKKAVGIKYPAPLEPRSMYGITPIQMEAIAREAQRKLVQRIDDELDRWGKDGIPYVWWQEIKKTLGIEE